MSLKKELLGNIKSWSPALVPHSQVMKLVHEMNYRESNAERRLRELTQSGMIEPVMQGKAIVGYKYKGITLPPARQRETAKLL